MIKRARFPKIFFGWWTVLGGGTLRLWLVGYQSYGFSALFKPIAQELGFSRAATSIAVSIARLEGGFEGPVAGWLTDRFGPRWIILLGVFLFGLSLILMNFINSLWAFYLVWGVMLGTGYNIAGGVPLETSISNWFVKKRGLALSIRYAIAGLCGVAVLPLIAWLISTQGWRMTCVIGGLITWFIGLPIAWFCLKQHRPEYYGLLPDGATIEKESAEASRMIDRGVKYAAEVEEVEFTLRQTMRTPAFWVLMAANAVHSMAEPAITMHGIPFLTDRGIDPVKAAVMLGSMSAISIPTRFVGGLLADRVRRGHIRFIVMGAYFIQAVAFAVLLLDPESLFVIYTWLALFYVGLGIVIPVPGTLRGRYFGRKAYGFIQGTSVMLMTPIEILAPVYCGWVYDTTGSYITAFTLIAALLGLSAVLAFFILPSKPPARITDIHKIV